MKQSKQPGPRRARRPRRPSGGRGRSLLQPLIFLLICAALVLGMSVFFRVAKIEVVGNSIYTAEEVVEASGIGIACIVARHFGVPVVFAKKSQSINIDGDVYIAEVESFTHKCKNQVIVSKKFLSADDHVLLIDDFLANGYALQGLISIVQQAGGTVEGIGIAVEKGFQGGGDELRAAGYDVDSLAIVESMDPETGTIEFRS
mgnify:CR=1 FL=1